MHGSTSPAKKDSPSCSHWTCSRTRLTARRASALAGSRPKCLSSIRLHDVEVHSGNRVPRRCGGNDCHHFSPASVLNVGAPPSKWPSSRWRASTLAPQPSLAMRARSAATSCAGASVRSRMTCQRIAGSESSSHSATSISFYLLPQPSASISPLLRHPASGAPRFCREQLADERLSQPSLEAVGRPAPTMDQHVVSTWSEQPDDIGSGFRVESGAYSALPRQVADDVRGALSMLRQVGVPESASVRIDAGCAPDCFVDARHTAIDLRHKLGIQSQVLAWIGLCSN